MEIQNEVQSHGQLRNLGEFGDSAGAHPFGDDDVSFEIEARIVGMDEFTILPQLFVFPNPFDFPDAFPIASELGERLIIFTED